MFFFSFQRQHRGHLRGVFSFGKSHGGILQHASRTSEEFTEEFEIHIFGLGGDCHAYYANGRCKIWRNGFNEIPYGSGGGPTNIGGISLGGMDEYSSQSATACQQ